MKAHSSQIPVLVWTLASLSLTSGFAQNNVQPGAATSVAVGTATDKSNPPPTRPRLSPWAREVMKLAQAGIEERVLLAFVENSGTFNLGADQIIHLNEAGVPGEVVTAMLQHDADLASGARMLTTTTSPPLDPELERILLAVRNAPHEASGPPKAASRPEAVASPEPAQVEWFEFQPEPSPLAVKGEPDESDATVKNSASLFAAKVPAAKASAQRPGGYRVPETRSVQLVPPIVVVNSASPPPNVIIIDMFPSSR